MLNIVAAIVAASTLLSSGIDIQVQEPQSIETSYAPTGVIVPTTSPCQATLDEVKTRLPKDLGGTWLWAELVDAGGLYFPDRDTIVIRSDVDCKWVGIIATHEWMHRLQDVSGLKDRTEIGGVKKLEIVAECAARVIADQQGWGHYHSYPEITQVPCSEVTSDVQALLGSL